MHYIDELGVPGGCQLGQSVGIGVLFSRDLADSISSECVENFLRFGKVCYHPHPPSMIFSKYLIYHELGVTEYP